MGRICFRPGAASVLRGRRGGYGAHTLRAVIHEHAAQGTLEYAITTIALLAMICVLALLWRAGAAGVLVGLAEEAASHVLDGMGALDVALY